MPPEIIVQMVDGQKHHDLQIIGAVAGQVPHHDVLHVLQLLLHILVMFLELFDGIFRVSRRASQQGLDIRNAILFLEKLSSATAFSALKPLIV